MTISTILRCACLLAIAAVLHAEIEIVSSTPMGFPCAQTVAPFPCREADNGWLVLAKSSTAAVRAVLRYREGSETKTMTVLESVNDIAGPATARNESGAYFVIIAFRPGRWISASEVVDVTVTELHEGASVKRDAGGTTITPGPTTFGPPINLKGNQ